MDKLIVRQFEGRPIVAITYQGRPCFLAGQIGIALGYERDGLRFVNQVTRAWSKDLIEGVDYRRVEGPELADLKAGLDTDLVCGRASSVVVLYESGVHLALMRTSKPAGRKLRRWLAEDVLPQIQRTGAYRAQPTPAPALAAGRKVVVSGRCLVQHDRAVVVSGEDAQRGHWLMRIPPSLAQDARDDPPSRVEVVLRIEEVRVRRGRVGAAEVVS